MFGGVLFGSRQNDEAMLRFGRGFWLKTDTAFPSGNVRKQLRASGLICSADVGRIRHWQLEARHPAYREVLAVLSDLGVEVAERAAPPGLVLAPQVPISGISPLGNRSWISFEILVAVATWPEPPMMRQLLQSHRTKADQIGDGVALLVEQGVLEVDVASVVFAEGVPESYWRLVRRLSGLLGPRDSLLDFGRVSARTATYDLAPDGAPRLFGPDVHLRTLMALASEGPMHHSDLARAIGTSVVKRNDTFTNAPFGRGALVVEFSASEGWAVALDGRSRSTTSCGRCSCGCSSSTPGGARSAVGTRLPPLPRRPGTLGSVTSTRCSARPFRAASSSPSRNSAGRSRRYASRWRGRSGRR